MDDILRRLSNVELEVFKLKELVSVIKFTIGWSLVLAAWIYLNIKLTH